MTSNWESTEGKSRENHGRFGENGLRKYSMCHKKGREPGVQSSKGSLLKTVLMLCENLS